MSYQSPSPASATTATAGRRAWIGGAVFTAGFVANAALGDLFADRPLPMPDAAPAEIVGYFAAEPGATAFSGVCILVSALGLAGFVRAVAAVAPPDRKRSTTGAVAIAAWAGCALLTLLLAVLGPAGASEAVLLVRGASFYTGGVLHVVALGAYVATLTLLRPGARTFGTGVRRFGAVAAVCAVLSIASLLLYPASILLPVGRLLCMVWTITAGVALARAPRGC